MVKPVTSKQVQCHPWDDRGTLDQTSSHIPQLLSQCVYARVSAVLTFRCIIPVVLYAIRKWVGTSKHNCLCILFIMLTTCFGHCGPSSGHKNVRGELYSVKFLGQAKSGKRH